MGLDGWREEEDQATCGHRKGEVCPGEVLEAGEGGRVLTWLGLLRSISSTLN